MTIHALISWYEESPTWLAATVASLHQAGVTSVVALDGAYGLYPNGRARSGTEQAHALTEACHALGMGLTMGRPQEKWMGNETEKRTALFRLADAVADPSTDWYWVIDADEIVTDCHVDLLHVLANTTLDVATCLLWERSDPHRSPKVEELAQQHVLDEVGTSPLRCLFRAIPGITVRDNHFTYVTPNARYLWGMPSDPMVPVLDLTAEVRIEHRTKQRTAYRTQQREAYYAARGKTGIELTDCSECGGKATGFASAHPDPHPNGVAIGTVQVCETCKPVVTERTRREIKALGFDPDALVPTGSAIAA